MNLTLNRENLRNQVAQIVAIEPQILSSLAREAAQINEEWTCEYGEYQSGGWKTIALYNQTRNPMDTVLVDGLGLETSLLDSMPSTRRFLRAMNLRFLAVRLAKLEPQAFLWEHKDYVELNSEEKIRLHIPLNTNLKCHLIVDGAAVHMNCGHIWFLNPTQRHGACNLGHQSRIHMLVDIYVDSNTRQWLSDAQLLSSAVTELPRATPEQIQNILTSAQHLAELGFRNSAEELLLRAFHSFSLYEGQSYNLIIQMYNNLKDPENSTLWRARKNLYLGRSPHGNSQSRTTSFAEQA